ncbi:23S rRNA (pseudouridine(1915)-N(3))-methyltransferase RlmH [Desulfohalobium retbaense]|uniref:Ribosomal RNA large subunit methyltransferase H n=1 Tax=Desulfohalobium retbaense (strain ATCC 49708 / DSM 5692 / JCM 16813 / HR100) TaxID=485915 RepID=C8WYS5_DESRD|nr:23S rRNA (pseudouridine(1915)-N(3))-methyltransferase RlmH [Desulfohalobium retbaense]ACV67841.1 protein of unknown function DUF163 [Desulfohalobium retbaense DSM 5692]
MNRLKCIWTGAMKKGIWRDAAELYWKRLSGLYTSDSVCVKDGPSHLAPGPRKEAEAKAILAKTTPRDRVIVLDERGKSRTSAQLAQDLTGWLEDPARQPCFILGGAYGLADQVRDRADDLLAFGPMTLPHELARVVLFEQLYRAATILKNIPYHH